MAALTGNYRGQTDTTYVIWNDTYVSGNVGYRHQSHRERELQQFLDEAEELAWYRRLQDEARERQALLDARSRRQRVHPKTKQQAGRRMQTYDAAMAMRQLRR